jgi:hypothetical protein
VPGDGRRVEPGMQGVRPRRLMIRHDACLPDRAVCHPGASHHQPEGLREEPIPSIPGGRSRQLELPFSPTHWATWAK